MRREIPAGAICCTEMVRILLKFHYDSLLNSILRIVVPGATGGGSEFRNLCASVNGRGRPRTKMINWSFLSFPGSVLQTRGPRISRTTHDGIPNGNRTPWHSGRFALQRIVHVEPGWTLHTDYPDVIAGTKGLHANRTTGKVVATLAGSGGKRSRVKSAVLMLSILVLSIMRTGSGG